MNIQTDKTSVASTTAKAVDIKRILQMIPHRYPMLMVDKVVDMQLDHSAVGIKNVSINEPFFQGHFPSEPVMPGVLIVEAMAQTAAVLVVALVIAVVIVFALGVALTVGALAIVAVPVALILVLLGRI